MSTITRTTVAPSPVSTEVQPAPEPGWCGRKQRGRVHWLPLIVITSFHIGALFVFVPALFTWKALITAVVLQFVAGMGVTIGYHRLLTHRSFKTFKPIEYFLSWCGSLSLEGGPILWVATHRLHHQHSDEAEDPHSPKHGFFWSHVLWTFTYDPEFDPLEKHGRYAKDLLSDRGHVLIERFTPLSQIIVAVLLFFWGGWPCVVWAGFLRLVYVYHITWLVNSASHTWGYQSYETGDESRNLWWVAFFGFGEGWHNNHHAFPNSARHGLKPWEFDISWITISTMKMLGLVWDTRVPDEKTLASSAITHD